MRNIRIYEEINFEGEIIVVPYQKILLVISSYKVEKNYFVFDSVIGLTLSFNLN